jgi:hypothetical protein
VSATVIDHPTPSGDYPEFRFDARGTCTWVLFQPPTEADWLGAFGAGDYGGNAVAVDWEGARALVVASGRGYLLDTTKRTIIGRLTREYLQDAVWAPESGVWVVADDLRLFVLDPAGTTLWASPRVSWDGIRRLRVAGDVVHGEADMAAGAAENDYWSPFALDLGTRRIEGALYGGPPIDFGEE